jgi:hypothetical protein
MPRRTHLQHQRREKSRRNRLEAQAAAKAEELARRQEHSRPRRRTSPNEPVTRTESL